MKRNAIVATVLLLIAGIATAKSSDNSCLKFNYGVKAGFQAVTYNHTNFNIEGYRFNDNTIQSSKVSYTINPFLRIAWKKFYIQTETALGITFHNFDFFETTEEDITPGKAEYSLTTVCFQIPLLIGYNFIDYDNYGMGFFTGPRTKFILTSQSKQDFSHFKYDNLYEELDKRNLYWELGLGVRIHNVFFDITYDWGLSTNRTKITDKDTGATYYNKRNESVLSFSVGFIF